MANGSEVEMVKEKSYYFGAYGYFKRVFKRRDKRGYKTFNRKGLCKIKKGSRNYWNIFL